MYLTRNQAYGIPVPRVRIPPSPPNAKASLCGAFCFLPDYSYNQTTMFRRLFAVFSLFFLLSAGASAFEPAMASPAAPSVSACAAVQLDVDLDSSCLVDAGQPADQLDWPEGLEVQPIASKSALLPLAVLRYVAIPLPSPCLGALQRPPCSQA